jgi:hypothetical protein
MVVRRILSQVRCTFAHSMEGVTIFTREGAMRLLGLLVMVLLCGGCAGRWGQNGKTDLDVKRDEFD